ncbi:carboxypeptidase regulatory-like domain-containing protein [Gemmatimonadota bacterium]
MTGIIRCPVLLSLAILLVGGCGLLEEDEGASLHITVVDLYRMPVAGAQVVLDEGAWSQTAGIDGYVRFEGLEPGEYVVQASASYHGTADSTVTVAADREHRVDLQLQRTHVPYKVSVRDALGGLSGATVTVLPVDSTRTTDDSGRIIWEHIPAGDYEVQVAADGHESQAVSSTVEPDRFNYLSVLLRRTNPIVPTARGGGASAVISGKLYTAQGWNYAILEVYDPITDQWEERAPPSVNMYAAGEARGALINGALVLAEFNSSRAFRYDPTTDVWSEGASMSNRRYGAAGAGLGGRLYIAGGQLGWDSTEGTDTVESYDPVSDTWSTVTPMPGPRFRPMAAVIGDTLFIVGGHTTGGTGGYWGTLAAYSPTDDTWTVMSPMPTPRSSGMSAVVGGKLYILGGDTSAGPTSVVEVYDPASDSWSSAPSLLQVRTSAFIGVIDGSIYIFGGYLGLVSTNSLEVYTP